MNIEPSNESPDPPRPKLAALDGYVPFFVILIFLFSLKGLTYGKYDLDFFLEPDDYAQLALGHAINIDFWIHGSSDTGSPWWYTMGRHLSSFQTTHPGIPYQLTSAVVYRLSTLGTSGSPSEKALKTLVEPSRFWQLDRLAGIFLTALFLFFLYRLGLRAKGRARLASLMVMSFFSYPTTWNYAIGLLGNETFALALMLLLATSLTRSFAAPALLRNWFYCGAISGLCYLNKMNYITWVLAAAASILLFLWLDRTSVARAFRILLAYAGGAAAGVVLPGLILLGPYGLYHMLLLHMDVVFHTGEYGAGDPGILDVSGTIATFSSFVSKYRLFCLAALMALAAAGRALIRLRLRPGIEVASLAFAVLAATFAFSATMKHYGEHYMIACAAAVPFLFYFSYKHLSQTSRNLLLVSMSLLFVYNGLLALSSARERYAAAGVYESELEQVRSLPMAENELRVWQYKVRSREYISFWTVDNSGIHALRRDLRQLMPNDLGVFRWRLDQPQWNAHNWRYLISERRDFDDFDSLPEDTRAISRVAFAGEHLLVVEKTSGSDRPQDPSPSSPRVEGRPGRLSS